MKDYKKPTLEIINIDGDVITASGAGCDADEKCEIKCEVKCIKCEIKCEVKCIVPEI